MTKPGYWTVSLWADTKPRGPRDRWGAICQGASLSALALCLKGLVVSD
jgi:hypothetical protein